MTLFVFGTLRGIGDLIGKEKLGIKNIFDIFEDTW